MFDTPILITAFNRPDHVKAVFEAVRSVQPKQLFVCIDGPRIEKENEEAKVNATRAIFNNIDWDCELKTLFRPQNLGCKHSVSGGIDWFFEHVEQGIILEDDCVPGEDFFFLTQDLLQKYKDDEQVYMIGGYNPLSNKTKKLTNSYFFAPYAIIYGWATWRRAWQHRLLNMEELDDFINEKKIDFLQINDASKYYIIEKFKGVQSKEIDSWAYGWFYTMIKNKGVTLLYKNSLTKNIGFFGETTHDVGPNVNREIEQIEKPIIHPDKIEVSHHLDQAFFYTTLKKKSELIARQILPKPILLFLRKLIHGK